MFLEPETYKKLIEEYEKIYEKIENGTITEEEFERYLEILIILNGLE